MDKNIKHLIGKKPQFRGNKPSGLLIKEKVKSIKKVINKAR